MASPSHRAPSYAMLDDVVSHPPPDAMLDGTRPESTRYRRCSTASSGYYPGHKVLARVINHRARLCLTIWCRQVHNRPVLDDHIQPQYGRGWCLTTGGRRALLEGVLDATTS